MPVVRNTAMPYAALNWDTGWQKDILEQIHVKYAAKGKEASALKVQSSFSPIWSSLYENMPRRDAFLALSSNDLAITKNMVGFTQKYYSQKITLADIAASGTVGQSK